MFKDSFKEVPVKKLEMLISILNGMIEGSPLEGGKAKALAHPLPFYDGYQFIEVRQASDNPPRKFNIIATIDQKSWQDGGIVMLDGSNAPLYALNKQVPIILNDENIQVYAQFFFGYVRGAQGIFQIINTIDDIHWHEAPALSGRKALEKMIEPISLVRQDEDSYQLKATIVFRDSLFSSDILVGHDGMISLTNQQILVEDLPISDQTLV